MNTAMTDAARLMIQEYVDMAIGRENETSTTWDALTMRMIGRQVLARIEEMDDSEERETDTTLDHGLLAAEHAETNHVDRGVRGGSE